MPESATCYGFRENLQGQDLAGGLSRNDPAALCQPFFAVNGMPAPGCAMAIPVPVSSRSIHFRENSVISRDNRSISAMGSFL